MSNEANMSNDIKNKTTPEENSSIYVGMNEVFDKTRSIIDSLSHGERIKTQDLADKVISQVKMPISNVMNLLRIFLKDCKDITIEVGRDGGIYKGGKVPRVDKRKRCESCGQVVRDFKQNLN